MADPQYAEEQSATTPEGGSNPSTDQTLQWYRPEIGDKLNAQTRKLLEEYSGIPPDEVEAHCYAVREAAWKVWPYPCIGQFHFLDISLSLHPSYPLVLERLRSSPSTKLLDLGCCFGQDIRVLSAAGIPSPQLHGSDIEPQFWDIGYELFKDRGKLQSPFVAADIFSMDPSTSPSTSSATTTTTTTPTGLESWKSQMDIIHIASFLHLFSLPQQLQACENIISLLRPEPGSMVLGRQVGSSEAGEMSRLHTGKKMYRHNPDSFRKMWDDVGRKTGTKWKVDVEAMPPQEQGAWQTGNAGDEPGKTVRLRFAVFREA